MTRSSTISESRGRANCRTPWSTSTARLPRRSSKPKSRESSRRSRRARPGRNPKTRSYRPSRNDWYLALGVLGIAIVWAVPVVAPLVLISNVGVAVYVSRLVATLLFAYLGAAYAKNLHRNPWPAAFVFGALGFGVFTLAYEVGW